MSGPTMPEEASRPGEQHPEQYRDDLNPNIMAGQNYGPTGPGSLAESPMQTAYDVKSLHRRLQEFTNDELKQIPVIPPGTRLEQGATYINLVSGDPTEITARGDMEARKDTLYVAKSEVDYQLWNRLLGVDNPERTGDA